MRQIMARINATTFALIANMTTISNNLSNFEKKRMMANQQAVLPAGSTHTVACFLCIAILVTILGNGAALIAFYKTQSLRNVTNYFITNLCLSDVFVATISIPFWVSWILTGWPSNTDGGVYFFWMCLDIFCGVWSIMSLAMISIERYVSISFPLHHESLVTKRRALHMVGFTLAYSAMVSMLGYAQLETRSHIISLSIFTASYIVPVAIKIFTYSRIYKEAKKHRNFILQEQKDRERLMAQRDLFSFTTKPIETSVTKEDKLHSIAKTKTESIEKLQQSPQAIKPERFTFKRRIINFRSLRKYSNRSDAQQQLVFVDQSPRGKVCCFGSREQMKVRSSQSDLSQDTDATHEYADSCIGMPMSSDSYDKIRQDWIDDWNKYIDALDGRNLTKQNSNHEASNELPNHEKDPADNCSKDETKLQLCSNFHLVSTESKITKQEYGTDAKASEERSQKKPSVHLLENNLPVAKGKLSPSRNLEQSSVRFFKSGSEVEIKPKGMCRLRKVQREVKAAKVIARVIGAFLCLWTPFMVVVVLSNLKVPVSMETVIATKSLHYVNSAINPVLYVVCNKTYRKAIFKLVSRMYAWV